MTTEQEYSANNIKALTGLTPIRTRPSMYIGSVDKDGVETIFREVIDNCIDEVINGHGDKVEVIVDTKEGYYAVRDYGRGIPVDMHESGKPAIQVLVEHIHSGGKFQGSSYKTSGGLNGVGIKATNALSDFFQVTSYRNGKSHTLAYEKGILVSDGMIVENLLKSEKHLTGTEILFSPDQSIFRETDNVILSQEEIIEFIKGRSFLSSNSATDKNGNPIVVEFELLYDEDEFTIRNENGIVDFVNYLAEDKTRYIKDTIFFSEEFQDKRKEDGQEVVEDVKVQVALNFVKEDSKNQRFFCNTIEQKESGKHVTGFKHGILAAFKNYIANAQGFRDKDREVKIISEDCLEFCYAIVSLFHSEPLYRGQDKSILTNTNAQTYTNKIIADKLPLWLEANPKTAKALSDRIITNAKARDKSKVLKEKAKNNDIMSMNSFGKLSDCSSGDRQECELFIAEGKIYALTKSL